MYSSIFAQFRYGGNKLFKYGTGLSINPDFWDPKSQRVKSTRQFPFHVSYNQKLNKIEESIQGTYYRIMAAGSEPTRNDFLDDLGPEGGGAKKEVMTLTKFMDMFLKERKESDTYARGSATVYKTVINKVKDYSAASKRQYDWKDIDLSFYYGFMKFLTEGKFATNYLHKIISTFKTILTDAKERGFNKYDAYKSKKFSISRAKTTKVYLNEAELKTLFEFKFKWPHHRNAADLFLLGAWSGFRESDFRKLIKENVEVYKGREIVKIQSVKGKRAVAVPLHDGIKSILELRGFPSTISQQKLNDYIKEACEEAGITTKIVRYKSINGKQVSDVVPKHEMITTHTARRSFATNMFLRGYPVSLIKEFMGHTTEKMTWGYICAEVDETAYRVAGDEFFKM